VSVARSRRKAFNASRGPLKNSHYANQDLGGFIFEATTADELSSNDLIVSGFRLGKVNVRAAMGLVAEPGLFNNCLTCVQQGSAGLVVAVRPRYTIDRILSNSDRFFGLSESINAPVFVVSNGPEVFSFSAGNKEPVLFRQ